MKSKGFAEGFKEFGDSITVLVNTILLLVVYLIGVGITSLVAKIVRKHFLERKIEKTIVTYWKPIHKKTKKEDFYRQF